MIYISGGSNSIRKGGWSYSFADLLEDPDEIKNISIGGTGSITSAWRVLFTQDIKPDDIVIWEYALNDSVLIKASSYSDELCLRFCEYVIRHVQESGARIIPLILTNLHTENRAKSTRYQRRLKHMFGRYGLDFIDIAEEARAEFNLQQIPEEYYEDPQHYVPGGPITTRLAQRTKELIDAGCGTPKKVRRPLYNPSNAKLNFHADIRGVEQEMFRNSLISTSINPQTPVPYELTPFDHAGQLSHLVVLHEPNAGAVRLTIGERTVSISVTPDERRLARAVRCVGLAGLFEGDPITFQKGDVLKFDVASPDDDFKVEAAFSKNIDISKLDQPKFQLIGMMTEETPTP
ncbi:MAG: hypothetical protein ABJP33_02280 [Pseudoruegeria sp.]